MHFCRFRAGDMVIGVETPEKLNITEPYSLFLCEDDAENDILIKFEYCPEITLPEGACIYKGNAYDVIKNGNSIHFLYHIWGDTEYYAHRITDDKKNNLHRILIPEEYKGMIWTRLVFSLINFDDLAAGFGASVFHASVVDCGGDAILFTAPCGTGKSTQAALWEKFRNADVINGDKALIYEKNGEFFVSGIPFSGSSSICKNRILPVKAIIRLSQAKENKAECLKGVNAYKAVYEGCYHSKWSAEYNNATSLVAEKFAIGVHVVSFACLPDETAVDCLEKFISEL